MLLTEFDQVSVQLQCSSSPKQKGSTRCIKNSGSEIATPINQMAMITWSLPKVQWRSFKRVSFLKG